MILVTGATGNNGTEIVKQLLATGASVRALVRNREKAATLGLGVEIVEGDLARPDTLDDVLVGVEKALLLSSVDPRQVELQGNFIEAAKRAGVKHMVKFSAMGADVNSPIALNRWHRQTEQQLEESGIAWTHLRPNDLMQNMLRFLPTIKADGTVYLPLKDGKVSMVDLRDVAAVAVKVLMEPGHEGKIYVITGPEALSYADITEKLSAAIRKNVTYVDVPPETSKQGMLDAGMPEWATDMMNTLYEMESKGSGAGVTKTVTEVTGKPPISFDQFAKDYVASFQS